MLYSFIFLCLLEVVLRTLINLFHTIAVICNAVGSVRLSQAPLRPREKLPYSYKNNQLSFWIN